MTQPNLPAPNALIVVDATAAKRGVMNQLAVEVAQDLEDLPVILARHKISQQQYDEKVFRNPYFQRALTAALEEWHAPHNAKRRFEIQCASLAEKALPVYFARATDPGEPLSAVNEAMKNLMRGAGIGERAGGTANGERFTISINLGEGKEINHEVKTIDITPTGGETHDTGQNGGDNSLSK